LTGLDTVPVVRARIMCCNGFRALAWGTIRSFANNHNSTLAAAFAFLSLLDAKSSVECAVYTLAISDDSLICGMLGIRCRLRVRSPFGAAVLTSRLENWTCDPRLHQRCARQSVYVSRPCRALGLSIGECSTEYAFVDNRCKEKLTLFCDTAGCNGRVANESGLWTHNR
jgi:hypothetical protein